MTNAEIRKKFLFDLETTTDKIFKIRFDRFNKNYDDMFDKVKIMKLLYDLGYDSMDKFEFCDVFEENYDVNFYRSIQPDDIIIKAIKASLHWEEVYLMTEERKYISSMHELLVLREIKRFTMGLYSFPIVKSRMLLSDYYKDYNIREIKFPYDQ